MFSNSIQALGVGHKGRVLSKLTKACPCFACAHNGATTENGVNTEVGCGKKGERVYATAVSSCGDFLQKLVKKEGSVSD